MDTEARSARLRLAAVGGVIALVIIITLALLFGLARTNTKAAPHAGPTVTSTVSATSRGPVSSTPDNGVSVPPVDLASVYTQPETADPITFARAYATALLSFDTRSQTYSARRAALLAWVPAAQQPGDATSMLDDFLGGEDTWDAMVHVHQSETIVINRAWIPDSMKSALAKSPEDTRKAGSPVAVTLSVTRQLRGDPGANSDLGYTLTVVALCPPGQACRAFAPARSVIEN